MTVVRKRVAVVWPQVRVIIGTLAVFGLLGLEMLGAGCVPVAGSVGATAAAPQAVTQTAVGAGNVVVQPMTGGISAWWTGHGLAIGLATILVTLAVVWWLFRRRVQPTSGSEASTKA